MVKTYTIDFDVYWVKPYPVHHTYGTFTLKTDNIRAEIWKRFLRHPQISAVYHFIIDDGESEVFEIKSKAD